MASRRKFTPEYRVEAANLVIETGRTAAEVSREIGVCPFRTTVEGLVGHSWETHILPTIHRQPGHS